MPIHIPSSIPLRIPFAPNRGFNFPKPIRIRNQTTKLTDYQIAVELNTSNFAFEKARSNGADIRFQDANGKALNYWIESWTSSSARIWVKLDELGAYEDRIIWMIYGNSDARNESNGLNTFLLFDDFDGASIDTDKWYTSDAPTTSSGNCVLSNDDRIWSKSTFGYDTAVRVLAKANEQDIMFISFRISAGIFDNNHINIYNSDASANNFDKMDVSSQLTSVTGCSQDNMQDFRNAWLTYEIHRFSNIVYGYQDDVEICNNVTNLPTVALGAGAGVWDSSQESILEIDWIFVRNCVLLEPLVEVL